MSPLSRINILFIFLIFSYSLHAQIDISGQIMSSQDSLPIPWASIYFDGTSIGVSSQDNGHFRIKTDKSISSDLIIQALGYKTINLKNPLELQNPGVIWMYESQESLDVVQLEADSWSRQKKLDIFIKEFLGNTAMANLCQIQNEDVLDLRYISSTNTLVASANEPLKIVNRYLGYEVTYNLTNFIAELEWTDENLVPQKVYYEGSSFFEELETEPSNRSLKNREKVFKGSYLHFMRSLAKKKLSENGFKISTNLKTVPPYTFFYMTPVAGLTEVKLLKDKLWISYGWNNSAIHANGKFYIDQHGNFTPPQNVVLSGRMGSLRVAGMLPLNYNL